MGFQDLRIHLERFFSNPVVNQFTVLIGAIIIIIITVSFLRRYLTRFIRDNETRYYVRKVISFIGYTLGFLLIVAFFSDRIGRLAVILGVAGAGIAFALQEVIASVAGWLAVSFSNFYRVGDRIQLGGIKGDVIDIGLLRTTLMECGEWVKSDLYTGRIVRIANSYVFKEPVFNYSGDFPFLWDEITIPVKHGSDYKLARTIILQVTNEIVGDYVALAQDTWKRMVNKYRIEDAQIEPMVVFVVTDNWIEFYVRYVVDYKKRRVTKDRIFNRLLEEFDKTNGRVSIASTTVQLVGAPVLDVRLSDKTK